LGKIWLFKDILIIIFIVYYHINNDHYYRHHLHHQIQLLTCDKGKDLK